MTIRKHPTDQPDPAFDEHEWQAQERAMQDARNSSATAGNDALAARYRAVSQALRQPPMVPIPMDFAARVARQAATMSAAADERFERVLVQLLIALLGLSVAVISVLYGSQWPHAFGQGVPSGSGPWIGLLLACGGLHWLLERWRRHGAAH